MPLEESKTKRAGKIAGWNIEFGSEGDNEYLDFYATHRMTNDRHVRIHSNGQVEGLETPQDFMVYPKEADEAEKAKIKEEYYAHNRAIGKRLREKGFLSRD